jgi:23S rRNA (pseudouridine1915-N3)-methyltransferase
LKITLLWVGKTKNGLLLSLIEEYRERLSHFCQLSLIEIRSPQEEEPSRLVTKEAQKILAKIETNDFLVLLDSKGKNYTSQELAERISSFRDRSLAKLVFVIGGHYGVSPHVRERANEMISLSRLTFNHEMIRLFFLEQLYRSFTIIHRIPYHK